MTVSSTTDRETFLCNGVTVDFDLPFRFFDNADIEASLVDNETFLITPLTLGVDFTLSGAGEPEYNGLPASSIHLLGDAPSSDFSLFVQRVMPMTQGTDIVNQGRFLPDLHEDVFDRLTMLVQQAALGPSRTIQVQPFDPIPGRLPGFVSRANKVFAFDENGDPIVSNMTLATLEQQPAIAQQYAEAAQSSAVSAGNSAGQAIAARDLAEKWAEEDEDVPVEPGKFSAKHWAAKAAQAAQWATQPIGVPIPVWTHLAGVEEPPTDNPSYRYIKLTASDSYNTGVLTSESVSGSAPLVQATAVINDAGSPVNGQTVRLINTERRVLRAGSSGTIQADALQNIVGEFHNWAQNGQGVLATGAFAQGVSRGAGGQTSGSPSYAANFDASRVARTADETRSKNIGADYFMRIR